MLKKTAIEPLPDIGTKLQMDSSIEANGPVEEPKSETLKKKQPRKEDATKGKRNSVNFDEFGKTNVVPVIKEKAESLPTIPVFTIVNVDDCDDDACKLENDKKSSIPEHIDISNMEKGISRHDGNSHSRLGRSCSVKERRHRDLDAHNTHHISLSLPHLSTDRAAVASAIEMRLRSWLKPMDNKMNMKVFGSKKAMRDEQMRYSRAGWVIHPTSIFRLYWDMWILLLLLINLFCLPVVISFFSRNVGPSWDAFNVLSDVAFLIDIVLNFRTGVLVHGSPNKFILEPKKIAVRYLKTWFAVDLISSLPFDYIVEAASESSHASSIVGATRTLKLLRFAKLLSLLKLLRLSRLVRYVQQYEEILNWTRSFIRFINLISIILLVAHWNGCLQFLVPMMTDFPFDSWVSIHNLKDATWQTQYCWSLFKALSHMLCIGYGRHPPQNISEVWVTTFSMLTGATFYAMFIAYCINFIQQLDSPGRNYREKLQQIEEYMSYRRLPVMLRDRMSKYYEHRYGGRMFSEERILHEVSRPLREKIINFNCRDLVQSVPFFMDADPAFVTAVITNLKFEVYLEGDSIIREGEPGTEMYFLKEGVVSVTVDGKKANELYDGAYFGEICLLANTRRTASVTAKTICDVFILHAEDFRDVVDEFPLMRNLMERVAEERLNKMGKAVQLSTLNAQSTVEPSSSLWTGVSCVASGSHQDSKLDARYKKSSSIDLIF